VISCAFAENCRDLTLKIIMYLTWSKFQRAYIMYLGWSKIHLIKKSIFGLVSVFSRVKEENRGCTEQNHEDCAFSSLSIQLS